MPNITSKNSEACGNDKCGTFAPTQVHPHHGGSHVLPGLGASGRRDGARNMSGKGRGSAPRVKHMHGGHPMSKGGKGTMPFAM